MFLPERHDTYNSKIQKFWVESKSSASLSKKQTMKQTERCNVEVETTAGDVADNMVPDMSSTFSLEGMHEGAYVNILHAVLNVHTRP